MSPTNSICNFIRFTLPGRITTLPLLFAILLSVFYATTANAAVLRDIYVNASSPLFAEIPVCIETPDENLGAFRVELVGNEEFDENGDQPFVRSLNYKLDTLNNLEGLLTITSELPLPEGFQLITTLVNQNGQQVDSNSYSNFATTGQAPDEFGCEQFQRVETTIVEEETPEPAAPAPDPAGLPFEIDIVQNDTWRNLAVFVNAAWYNNAYSTEQVMAALYQHNLERTGVIPIRGSSYSLPTRLEVPTRDVPTEINHSAATSLASLLDGSGRFKGGFRVERKPSRSAVVKQKPSVEKEELEKVRAELDQLKEQLALLSQQLTDARELLNLRNDELAKVQEELLQTRKRLAELESINEELKEKTSSSSYLIDGLLRQPWVWLVLLLALAGIALSLFMNAQRRRENINLMRMVNSRRDDGYEKKN